MNQTTNPVHHQTRITLLFLLGTAAFAVAYGQAPLYYSNQNQYFLHGLAEAGCGLLREDWLAGTLDPTPVFSALVAFTARLLWPWVFHVYHGLLLAAYAAALVGVFAAVVGLEMAVRRWPIVLALLILVHSALARWLSYRLLGQDYPWYFQAGVAGQYVLGAMLQPSVFGVLLVVAVCLFIRGRPILAVVCVAAAATVHSTYLLAGGLLTVGFLAALLQEGRLRQALALGALALALVLPITAYVLLTFAPTSAESFAEAQDILVNVRIPHHCRPDLWFDPIAALQVLWIVLALALVWRTQLFAVLAVPFTLSVLLTLAQVATGSNTLALLFPWRISAVLVPIATAIILSRLVAIPGLSLGRPVGEAAAAAVVVGLAAAAVWIMVDRQAFNIGDEETLVTDFVRRTREPGDVYFLPVRVPELAKTTRGSLSSDFKPPAAKKSDTRIIPVDLQRFRLAAGAPIYEDFKAIPYKDVEVIEWRDRLLFGEMAQAQLREGPLLETLGELRRRGITHLVWPASVPWPVANPALFGLREVHSDPFYQVYRLGRMPTKVGFGLRLKVLRPGGAATDRR